MTDPGPRYGQPRISFEAAFRKASTISGWLTESQARVLYERASQLRSGQSIVEIGSHRGRSTVILASAIVDGVELIAIDPYSGGQRQVTGAHTDAEAGELHLEAFWRNMTCAGVNDRLRLVREYSQDAHADVKNSIDLLYIDGAHELRPAFSDIRGWGNRVAPNGTMLIHDAFSSTGVTLAQIVQLFFGRRFAYVGRSRSLAEYRCQRVSGLSRLRNAARQSASLPWFARNIGVKTGMRLHAGRLVRFLGHHDVDYPF